MVKYSNIIREHIDTIHSYLCRNELTVSLKGKMEQNDIMTLIKFYFCKHPEMIFVKNDICSFTTFGDKTIIRFQRKKTWNSEKCKIVDFDFSDVLFLQEKAEKIIADMNITHYDTMHKAIKIFDYLANSVRYETTDNAHDAWGAIMEKKSVCEGIAYSFCLLSSLCNIDSVVVFGTLKGQSHAWNMININGLYYHIDVTAGLKSEGNNYDFLFLTDADLTEYQWNKNQYPTCNSVKHNYFHYTDSFARTENELLQIIERQLMKGCIIYARIDKMIDISEKHLEKSFLSICNKHNMLFSRLIITVNTTLRTFQIKYYK